MVWNFVGMIAVPGSVDAHAWGVGVGCVTHMDARLRILPKKTAHSVRNFELGKLGHQMNWKNSSVHLKRQLRRFDQIQTLRFHFPKHFQIG